MSEKPQFECFLGLCPFTDGSGYRVKVTGRVNDEGPRIDIETIGGVSTAEWRHVVGKTWPMVNLLETIAGLRNGQS